MLHCRLNLGSCRSPLRPIMAVGWNIRLEKYESGYQYLQGSVWEWLDAYMTCGYTCF